MYCPTPRPPPFVGPFPPNYSAPRRPYPASYAGVGASPAGPFPPAGPWPSVPMNCQTPGQIPPGLPPRMSSLPIGPTQFQSPLPSPRHYSRRHSIHFPAVSRPGLSRSSTFIETSHRKIDGSERYQKKSRDRHGSSNDKRAERKEKAEKVKENRRRRRDASYPNTQNTSQKKAEERQRDGPTTVNITILKPEHNGRQDEPDKNRDLPRKMSPILKPQSRNRSSPEEERPSRTKTPRPLSLHTMPLRAPQVSELTPPQTPRLDKPSPRVSNVERDTPIARPRSTSNPESSDQIQIILNILKELNQRLQSQDKSSTVRSVRAIPSSMGYYRNGRKKRPLSHIPRRRRLPATSDWSTDSDSDDLWDDVERDGIHGRKATSPKKESRSESALDKMEQRIQNAKRHQRNTTSRATRKSFKGHLSSISGLKRQRDNEGDLNLILQGLLKQLSRYTRTADSWDDESVLDDVRSGKYVVALVPTRSISSQGIPKYKPQHIPRFLIG
ncbi:hypothetical protein F5Y07DRAFT_409536 [Xylaria sp. FL0933]|nr:hypothetical protein F5Y07DRAFT_409536 [Xylaria sp. FL0933]